MPLRHHHLIVLVLALLAGFSLPAGASESNTFVDDDRSRFEPYIERAAAEGIVTGCNPPDNDRFCPDRVVTRGEMAIMLAQALDAPPSESSHFVDVDGHPAEKAIAALDKTGVVDGCGDQEFCPDRLLTRGEMSTLIANALGWELSSDTAPYVDLEGATHGSSLAQLARRGALEPCDPPAGVRLCPKQAVTRADAAFSLVSALGLRVSDPSRQDQDFPLIGFEDSFDSLELWDGRTPSLRNRVGLAAGFEGRGLRVMIPKGSHFGADFKLDLATKLGEEPERLYFRYLLRLDPDWVAESTGKLPGFSGVYGRSGKGGFQSTPSSPGWSARVLFYPNSGDDPRVRLGYYVYHLGQERRFGESMAWNEAGMLVPGEWYCIEGEVLLNTPGMADGALRGWVDGTRAFDASGLEFRRPDEPSIRIESFWFNVYHGGKAVSVKDLGLTVDLVTVDSQRLGCEVGDGVARSLDGNFLGSGFDDRLQWGPCPGGTCFSLLTTSAPGVRGTMELGDGAWFSLETHSLGMASGDLNGNGRDELVYWGRCAGGERCWRAHMLTKGTWSIGENWGGEARFSHTADAIVVGDWDGDGLADIAYLGVCGSDRHYCWKVHRSLGDRFSDAENWGRAPRRVLGAVAADVTGNGQDDIVYRALCGDKTCWFAQVSSKSGFAEPIRLGRAPAYEREWSRFFDWDGNGIADVVSVMSEGDTHKVQVRLMKPDGLTGVFTLAEFRSPITDVLLERRSPSGLVEALVLLDCAKGSTCVEHLMGWSLSLLSPSEYHERLRAASHCGFARESVTHLCPQMA